MPTEIETEASVEQNKVSVGDIFFLACTLY